MGILELQATADRGIKKLKADNEKAEKNAQEFALTLISIADQLVVKLAKQRNFKSNKIELEAQKEIARLQALQKEQDLLVQQLNSNDKKDTSVNGINQTAQNLAMSILDISSNDLNEILTGRDPTGLTKKDHAKIKSLELEAELVRKGLERDIEWQEKFVAECRNKKAVYLHDFSQSICKDLCGKIEELTNLFC